MSVHDVSATDPALAIADAHARGALGFSSRPITPADMECAVRMDRMLLECASARLVDVESAIERVGRRRDAIWLALSRAPADIGLQLVAAEAAVELTALVRRRESAVQDVEGTRKTLAHVLRKQAELFGERRKVE